MSMSPRVRVGRTGWATTAHCGFCGRFPRATLRSSIATAHGCHPYALWNPWVWLACMGNCLTECRDGQEVSDTSSASTRGCSHTVRADVSALAHAHLRSCSWSTHIWPFSLKLGDVPPHRGWLWDSSPRPDPREHHERGAAARIVRRHSSGGPPKIYSWRATRLSVGRVGNLQHTAASGRGFRAPNL